MFEKKIMVVDDEVAILGVMKEIFEMKGYQVATAESAEEAIRYSAKRPSW